MDSWVTLLTRTDWSALTPARGPAGDVPGILAGLFDDDMNTRGLSFLNLYERVFPGEELFAATGPAARVVAAMLTDPRTLWPVHRYLPTNPPPWPMRLALVEFLAGVAAACEFDVVDDASLAAEAALVAAGRGPQLPPWGHPTAARDKLACRGLAPELFEGLRLVVDDPDCWTAVRALEAGLHLTGHREVAAARPDLLARLAAAAPGWPVPWTRAAAARLMGMFGGDPRDLLADEHPGVRASAALAPTLADDPRALSILVETLLTPRKPNHWFSEYLPGPRLRPALLQAVCERVADFGELLPVAVAVAQSAIVDDKTLTVDVGGFLAVAFPRPLGDGEVLTPAQREYVSVLVGREHLWRLVVKQPWFQRTGLPRDPGACQALLTGDAV